MAANLSLYRGVSYPSTYQHTDGNGNNLPLTNSAVLITIKPNQYDDDLTDNTAIFKVSATITNPTAGTASWTTLIPSTVDPTKAFYDITVVTNGQALPPVLSGKCTILAKTTNRTA
jgi:hypothetical protein